jgi:hypothetical protein
VPENKLAGPGYGKRPYKPERNLPFANRKAIFMITKAFTRARKNGGQVFVIMAVCSPAGVAALRVEL